MQTEHIKVTIAIPVYNAAKHLQANLDSLQQQTMNPADFEIIFVDNCSTDNTRQVLEQFAQTMPNVRMINKPVNSGGPFASMNDALDAAKGKYIHYLDSDDFLCDNALEQLYEAAETYHSDIIFGKYIGVNGRPVPTQMYGKGTLHQASLYTDHLIYSLAPHKMFATAFIREHGIRFHTASMAGNADQLFMLECYLAAKTITVLADLNHYYVVARGKENLTSKVYPADAFFVIPHLMLQAIDRRVADREKRNRLKSIFINRFLETERLKKFLLDPQFPLMQKPAWMQEGKKLLEATNKSNPLELVAPENQSFAQAICANDLEVIAHLAQQRQQRVAAVLAKREIHKVTTKKKELSSYVRPSAQAARATPIPQPDKPFQVFYTTPGWFEVRLPLEEGGTHAVFVKKSDVWYTLSFMLEASFYKLKKILPGAIKKKATSVQ